MWPFKCFNNPTFFLSRYLKGFKRYSEKTSYSLGSIEIVALKFNNFMRPCI